MPLDINGYDSASRTFVKSSQHRSQAGQEGNAAAAGQEPGIWGRNGGKAATFEI